MSVGPTAYIRISSRATVNFADISRRHKHLPQRVNGSYRSCLAFADDFVVFLLPFMGKLIQLIESSTDFLHALGQVVGHGRRDRGLIMAVDKSLLFQVP